jgi:hypothetical protein
MCLRALGHALCFASVSIVVFLLFIIDSLHTYIVLTTLRLIVAVSTVWGYSSR